MDEQEVRLLIRQAIGRHMGAAPGTVTSPVAGSVGPPSTPAVAPLSVARFHLPRAAGETECIIEPTVTCTHCGHCQCYGH